MNHSHPPSSVRNRSELTSSPLTGKWCHAVKKIPSQFFKDISNATCQCEDKLLATETLANNGFRVNEANHIWLVLQPYPLAAKHDPRQLHDHQNLNSVVFCWPFRVRTTLLRGQSIDSLSRSCTSSSSSSSSSSFIIIYHHLSSFIIIYHTSCYIFQKRSSSHPPDPGVSQSLPGPQLRLFETPKAFTVRNG